MIGSVPGWAQDQPVDSLNLQLYACSNDMEACIYNVLCHQEGGNDRFWNLRFYKDFHERELVAAISFLDFM